MNRARNVPWFGFLFFLEPSDHGAPVVSVPLFRESCPAQGSAFEVVCYCGETVTGARELHRQEIGCPHCGKTLFVLPADLYATKPRPAFSGTRPAEDAPSGTVIDKLNRLAFWTRLRESRKAFGNQIGSLVRRMGQWVKRRFRSS